MRQISKIIKEAFCIKKSNEYIIRAIVIQMSSLKTLEREMRRCEEIPTKWNEMIFFSRSLVDMRAGKKTYIRNWGTTTAIICVKFFAHLTVINKQKKDGISIIIYLRLIDYISKQQNFCFLPSPTFRSLISHTRLGHWSNNPRAIWFFASDSVQLKNKYVKKS